MSEQKSSYEPPAVAAATAGAAAIAHDPDATDLIGTDLIGNDPIATDLTGTAAATPDPAGWAARQSAQAEGFDAIGARYDEAFPHKDGQIACVERLLADLPPGARVLDAGAGTGLPTARRLVDAGCAVTCVDFSAAMLDLARANVPEATFVRSDLLDLPDDPGQYEAVTAFFCLLMLPRAQIVTALRRFHRILTPGGRLAVAMVEADVDDVPIPFLGNWLRVTAYLRDEWREVLTAAGFDVEWEEALTYVPEQVSPEVQLFALCRKVERC